MLDAPPADSPPPRPVRARWFLYSLVVCLAFFAGINALIEALEDEGVVDTHDPDDRVQHLAERIWTREDDAWVTTRYGTESFVRDSFAADPDQTRVFVVGGSFAMGTPYAYQGRPPQPGTIPAFLDAWMQDALGERAEVINAGAGAQDSNRVVQVAKEALEHDPDALVVATCNNEGALPPGALASWLKEQGGYRLLEKLLSSQAEPERTMFTAQSEAVDAIAKSFEANLETIAADAARADVPVVLATLPVHLLYRGLDEGHHTFPEAAPWYHLDPAKLDEDVPDHAWLDRMEPCQTVLMLQEAREWELSLAAARRCTLHGFVTPISVLVARARFHLGRPTGDDEERLRAHFGSCVYDGMVQIRDGDREGGVATLGTCEEGVAEAVRWIGIAEAEGGEVERARQLLRRSVELKPRNRCRPSFNAIIRAVADRHDHVHLVDLEEEAERIADGGLPGNDLFFDSCHMTWRGYGAMAAAVARELRPLVGVETALDVEELGARDRLPRGDAVQQIRYAYESWDFRDDPVPDSRAAHEHEASGAQSEGSAP